MLKCSKRRGINMAGKNTKKGSTGSGQRGIIGVKAKGLYN